MYKQNEKEWKDIYQTLMGRDGKGFYFLLTLKTSTI